MKAYHGTMTPDVVEDILDQIREGMGEEGAAKLYTAAACVHQCKLAMENAVRFLEGAGTVLSDTEAVWAADYLKAVLDGRALQ